MRTDQRKNSSDDWTLVGDQLKKSDDNASTSDIEVISNPASDMASNPDTGVSQPPKLLYSEMVKRAPPPESDIEFVPDPMSPQLEFDDEEYLTEILKSTRISPHTSEAEDSDSDSELLPEPAMSVPEMNAKEVVLEVNLTLLSFSIIIGISSMSGFFMGGIYHAMLNGNLSATSSSALYPGALPNHFYREDLLTNTCPNTGCGPNVYRLEENMKHLKQTMSHDITNCHNKLKHAVQENKGLHQTLRATAQTRTAQCAASKVEIANLQSGSAALLVELEDQKVAFKNYKHHANAEAARNGISIASLRQMLDNSRNDLVKARGAVSVLDKLNTECRKDQILSGYVKEKAVTSAKKNSDETTFWKNLYKHAILDLEEAEQKIAELEKLIVDEMSSLKKSQVAQSNNKINYLRERNAKNYYKTLAEKYAKLIGRLDEKYMSAKDEQVRLTQEFEVLKSLTDEMESNLESCTNASVISEQRTQNAVKSKMYIESILMNKISNDKDKYVTLKQMYSNQEKMITEMEMQRAALEETLVRKISANRQRFLDTKASLEETMAVLGQNKRDASKKVDVLKSKVGKNKNAKHMARTQLEESKVVIAEYQEQLDLFESYTKQIESHLSQLREDLVMREAIQREYIASKVRQHHDMISDLKNHYETLLASNDNTSSEFNEKYNQAKFQLELLSATLTRRNYAFNELKSKHEETSAKLEEQVEKVDFWKESYTGAQQKLEQAEHTVRSCRSSKNTAIAEYKRTTDMLLDLISDVASKPKCRNHAQNYFLSHIVKTPDVTPRDQQPRDYPVSVVPESDAFCPVVHTNVTSPRDQRRQVKQLLKVGGENFSLLQHIYNTTSPIQPELDTCLAVMSPLFPTGVSSRTLSNLMNMSQSKAAGHKMHNAIQKYWGGVDKTYKKLAKKFSHDDDDDDDDDEEDDDWYLKRHGTVQPQFYPQGPETVGPYKRDWYLNRKPLTGKGEYSYVNKDRTHKKNKSHKTSDNKKRFRSAKKGEFDCRMFDCVNTSPMHFGFDLCGC